MSPAMAHTGEEIHLWEWAEQWQLGTPALSVEDEDFDGCTFIGPVALIVYLQL